MTVRGKKKLGYELKMELMVRNEKVEGMIRIWELCDDNDEPESFDVYCTKGMENGGNSFVKAITME